MEGETAGIAASTESTNGAGPRDSSAASTSVGMSPDREPLSCSLEVGGTVIAKKGDTAPDEDNKDRTAKEEEEKQSKMNSPHKICETPDCGKAAPLQCPKCLELQLKPANFCSQPCFKSYYAIHKKAHMKPAAPSTGPGSLSSSNGAASNCKSEDLLIRYPTLRQTGTLLPYKQTAMKTVPPHIQRPDYADDARGVPHSEISSKRSGQTLVLDEEEIAGMRKVCVLGREVIEIAAKLVKVGVTTDQIDSAVHAACIERECYPSPLNYYNFPKSCCTSVNEVVCHGIPDLRPLRDGDIVNVDISVFHKGFHADLNETYFVGTPDQDTLRLVTTSYECLDLAIQACKPGMRFRDVGAIIQKHAQSNNCSVVRTYCGHGIHHLFHCAPTIPHYAKNKAIGVMKPGNCFTIEPMINAGKFQDEMWPDNWTSVTCDGKRSAQFEQTLLITESGCEVLTQRPDLHTPAYFMQQLNDLSMQPFQTNS